jgi:hypothetical protein
LTHPLPELLLHLEELPQGQEPAARWRPMLQRPVMMQLLRLKTCNCTTLLLEAVHLPCRHDRTRMFHLQWLLVLDLELRELRLPPVLVQQMMGAPAARSAQAGMQTRSVSVHLWLPRARDS